MQGMGVAYALAPLASDRGSSGNDEASALLVRHLQRFNTHPYLTAPVIGSVLRLEVEGRSSEAVELKNALMGPYAAIGDTFFWGALRPFSGVAAVCLAAKGLLLAPFLFLFLYNPLHLWVRARGFLAGWQKGKDGIEFIGRLGLPDKSRWVRWGSTLLLGVAAYLFCTAEPVQSLVASPRIGQAGGFAVVLAGFLAVRKGVPPLAILYGSVMLFAFATML